jgi:hypothetical protein
LAKKDLADLVYAQMLKALKSQVNKAGFLVQDFVEKNKDSLALKDLSTITIKRKKIKTKDKVDKEDKPVVKKEENETVVKKEEKPTTVKKEDKSIKIKNLINKTSSEIDKIIDPLKTNDLKDVLKDNKEE